MGLKISDKLPTTCNCKDLNDAIRNECMVCGMKDCEWNEPLHYHHDGCPAAYNEELKSEREEKNG